MKVSLMRLTAGKRNHLGFFATTLQKIVPFVENGIFDPESET
jgi:hypothetical protein